MRKILALFLFLTAILVAHLPALAQNNNQTKFNLNFDKVDPDNQVMPEGWFKWGNFKTVTGEKLKNENSVGKVVSDNEGKFGCITYRIPANYDGDTIRLSGKIKHEDVKGNVGLLMRIDGISTGKPLAFENMHKYKLKGTSDWQEYSIQLPYPAGAEMIYVGGILSGAGTAWFDDFKITIDGIDIQGLEGTPKLYLKDYNKEKFNSAIDNSSIPLNLSDSEILFSSLDPLIDTLGDKKIVAIGESTHGTSEYYRMREIISKRLIQEKGFNLVILENPYDEIELFNQKLKSNDLESLMKDHLFSIYQTEEVRSFLQWYKENHLRYNVRFKGSDDSFWSFYELLEYNLGDSKDKKLKNLLSKLKSNMDRSLKKEGDNNYKFHVSIYSDIVNIENHLKQRNNLTAAVEEILFNGKNTYINYVNLNNRIPIQSRDEIMAKRISYLAKDPDNKIIVWAHNAHISNAVIADNEIGIMGRDLKKEFGDNYHSIGLTTLSGNYSYIDQKFINGDRNFHMNFIKHQSCLQKPTSGKMHLL